MSTDDILRKYGDKIKKQMNQFESSYDNVNFTRTYESYKEGLSPDFTNYEKWCKSVGKTISVKVKGKDAQKIQKNIDIAHLNVSPSEVMGLAAMLMMITIVGGLFFVLALYLIIDTFSVLMLFLFLFFGLFIYYFASKTPERLAMKWRLKASSQMVPALLYIVIYMKHTSNLEKAVAFAAENLEDPLSSDFKRIFWEVQSKKYSTIKEAIDIYLEGWKDYSMEFVEAIHLVSSSLFESSEGRRVEILERALTVILDGVYDKMLKYTHEVKSPLTNVYMLGIVLPTLALAILPLASTMLNGAIKVSHLFIMFNLMIPFFVIYMTYNIMSMRPGGYGDSGLLSKNPLYEKFQSKKSLKVGFLIALPLFLIGIFPIVWGYTPLHNWLNMPLDWTFGDLGFGFMESTSLFGLFESDGKVYGPFGPLSLVMSLFIPIGIAVMFSYSFRKRTVDIIKEKERYRQVESEFTSSLFQLGNRIGDGLPAEVAFGKIAESSKGTASEGFFAMVSENIRGYGMSIDRAIFDESRGAAIYYPSHLIVMSMRILVESVKKGLQVAARSLMSISEYVKNVNKVQDRLKDLLAEIISDMRSNMGFLAPMLSGIIVGLSGMITLILGNLETIMGSMDAADGIMGAGALSNLSSMFNLETMLPTYWIQIVVGIYLIEIVFILSSTLVTINNGKDDLTVASQTGINLAKSMMTYFAIALVSIVALTLIAGIALAGIGG